MIVIIICEGCDNTGKTTLIKKLINSKIGVVGTVKSPGPATGLELCNYMDDHLVGPKYKKPCPIYDRFPIPSELVYGPILRGGPVLTPEQVVRYSQKTMAMNPLFILCELPEQDILDTFHEREQLEGVQKRVRQISDRYNKVIESLHPNWLIRYNFKREGDYEEVERMIKLYLKQRIGRR